MTRSYVSILVVVAALAGCGGSGGESGAADSTAGRADPAAASTSTAAAGGDVTPFVDACLATSNLSRPICECTARKAMAQLSPDGYAHLTATLRKEEARAAELRGRLSAQDMMASGTFMVRGPGECAREAAGIPATTPAARP